MSAECELAQSRTFLYIALLSIEVPHVLHFQPEFPVVKAMLSHDPEERPETSDVLSMEFLEADTAADDNELVTQFRRQRRKTASTESEE